MSDLGNGGIKTLCNTKLMKTKKVSGTNCCDRSKEMKLSAVIGANCQL